MRFTGISSDNNQMFGTLKRLGGATRPPEIHWGGSMLNCSFYLDDELIVDKGTIVHPDCK